MTQETIISGLLADKIVLVTGAGRGIGAAAARLFAQEGATVVLTARTGTELAAVTEEITKAGGRADYVAADASDIQEVVDELLDRHGRLDLAFNNAATSIPPVPLADVPAEDFDRIIGVNLRAVWQAMAAEVRAIKATAGTGAVVNNSSVGSWRANPGLGVYSAAKRALNSLTQTAAAEYGPQGIRINAIAPGTTLTSMIRTWAEHEPALLTRLAGITPLRRAAEPVEIAQAAAWLLSDRASFVTGAVLPVDGGMSA